MGTLTFCWSLSFSQCSLDTSESSCVFFSAQPFKNMLIFWSRRIGVNTTPPKKNGWNHLENSRHVKKQKKIALLLLLEDPKQRLQPKNAISSTIVWIWSLFLKPTPFLNNPLFPVGHDLKKFIVDKSIDVWLPLKPASQNWILSPQTYFNGATWIPNRHLYYICAWNFQGVIPDLNLDTVPEMKTSHLKMDGWLLGPCLERFARFRECIYSHWQRNMAKIRNKSTKCIHMWHKSQTR